MKYFYARIIVVFFMALIIGNVVKYIDNNIAIIMLLTLIWVELLLKGDEK